MRCVKWVTSSRPLASRSNTRSIPSPAACRPYINVLLAEANVPFDDVFELKDINSDFGQADVASGIGANDVTNPVARDDKTSPIYDMPILDVDKAKTCLLAKRSLGPG
jgi:NAD(P) transhydrogenase subunit beta